MEAREPSPDALLEDYKLKVGFAENQIGRLQTQFQILLALEALLATALVVSSTGSLSQGAKWVALLEFAISLAWLMIGWAGTAKARLNRRDVEEAGRTWAYAADLGPDYRPVGSGQKPFRIAITVPAVLTVGWAILFIALPTPS